MAVDRVADDSHEESRSAILHQAQGKAQDRRCSGGAAQNYLGSSPGEYMGASRARTLKHDDTTQLPVFWSRKIPEHSLPRLVVSFT